MKFFKTTFFILLSFISLDSEAKMDNYKMDAFIPSGSIYVQAESEYLLSCANEKLKNLAYGKETEILVTGIRNATGNLTIPTGIREMLFTALFQITEDTNLFIQDHGIDFFQSVKPTATPQFMIAGAQVDLTEAGSSRALGGGLFTKYFGIGIGRGAYMSLATIDLRLVNNKRRLKAVASLSTILKRLDKYAESDGSYREKGLHLNWGKDSGESIALAQRMLVNLAAVMFLEKIVDTELTCKKNTREISFTNDGIEEIVVKPSLESLRKMHYPRSARSSFKCRGRKKKYCRFQFRGEITPSLVKVTENAFRNSFTSSENLHVTCNMSKNSTRCSARGSDVSSFNYRQFRKNLYGS